MPAKPSSPPEDRSPLQDCLCFTARLAARRLTAFYEARLAPHGLTITQFGLLVETGRLRNPTMGKLAELLEQDPSTLSRTLRVMEQDGLIEIVQDTDNRRLRRVTLTSTGKTKVRAAAQSWQAAQEEALTIVPQNSLCAVLEATENLGD
jgi:DNA-binding MarR family transcriptional regulator